jgi:signal transduction histidine kinase
LSDLIGKRLMLEPQTDELLAYLKKEGIPIEQITVLPHSFDADGLMQGKTDAIAGYLSNEPYFFRDAGFPYQIYSPRSAGIDFYGDNLFTSERELREHPERVKAFRAASLRGWKYAKEHRDEVIALIQSKYAPHYSLDYLHFESDQMIPLLQPDLIEIGYMNPSRWRHIADTYADLGLMSRDFPLDDFIYDADGHDLTRLTRWMVIVLLLGALAWGVTLYVLRINRKLKQAHQTVERTLVEQGRFMDMLTHELKTLISVVRMSLGPLDMQGKTRGHAERALQDMSDIVERCRQMDQLEQHKLSTFPQRCRVDELLRQLCGSYMATGEAAGRIELTAEQLPELHADEQLLRIILANLIGNAVKYSLPESAVEIHAQSERYDGIEGVQVTVQNLPGAAGAPDPAQVFGKYYRSPGASGKSGSGLGLYLVRSITGLLRGHIAYDVVQNKVRFSLWLPY